MSLTTHSKFYYGYSVDIDGYQMDFDEGGSELTAELTYGSYTLTEFVDELETALNSAGALTYTVTVNRTTQKITIAATGNFTLRITSGTHIGTGVFTLAGFTGANVTGAATYTGDSVAGSSYETQFILQSHIGSDDNRGNNYGTLNKSASGKVELISYGDLLLIEFNIKFATNSTFGAATPIRNNATGVADLRAFMQYLITKAPLEYMPDENTPATYQKVILESTPDDSNGTRYKLKELYGIGLPGYFETGILKFRVVE